MQKTRCREITETDIDTVAELLTRGFVGRSREYWMQGLRRQAACEVPDGYPRFGHMLDHAGMAVGVLLQLYTSRIIDGEPSIHCNLSSWYVDPEFRNYAPMLTGVAQRHKNVTYFNISPAHWTWPIIEAQGFRAYCNGLFFSVPALSRVTSGTIVETISPDATTIDGLPQSDVEQRLAALWQGAVGMEQVGLDDDFQDLGMSSIAALQLAGRVSETFGVEVAVKELFNWRTLRAAAMALQAALKRD